MHGSRGRPQRGSTSAKSIRKRWSAFRERLEGVIGPEYLRSLGAPGVHHFMAFEGERPVASAVLYAFEELGYLGMALTAEPFRRRGAQSALIAQRIKKAVEVGCKIVVSETLSIAKHSLGNLQKAGFEVAYEKEVYGLFSDNEPTATSRALGL
jgi:GNAT superfamily N-acetyltransferase